MTKPLTQSELLALYNALAPKQVNRFENRAIALDRVEKLLKRLHLTLDEAIAKVEAQVSVKTKPVSAPSKAPSKASAKAPANAPAPAAPAPPAPVPETAAAPASEPKISRVTRDRVTEDEDGFYAVVNGITYGTWATKGAALAGLKTEQERAARKQKGQASDGSPRGSAAVIIRLCTREQGATAKEMADALGWPSIAARANCIKIAERFGYTVTVFPKGKGESLRYQLEKTA